MALVFSSVFPFCVNLQNVNHITKVHLNSFVHCKVCNCLAAASRLRNLKGSKFVVRNKKSNFLVEKSHPDFDWEDEEQGDLEEEDDDDGSPWEGAVVYKRNSSVTHLEYCTTLERLGLGKLSTKVSRSRASVMGLRVTKDVKDYPDGTPVLISLDVTRKKLKLRLDGIIRTVIALGCNRCGEPAAESIFSNFSLLLSEEPIKEPETLDMGIMFGEDTFKSFGNVEEEMEDNDGWIPLEDQLYFPPEEKVIDISKQIRDLVHIEITISAVCDPKCKGLCLKCGANLNVNRCSCHMQKVGEKGNGPLGGLKKQMQQT
ncbi:large ribosomal RNA subunit accumulation protein YCED homolog 1, chloroplastic [Solanum dulcamara]|uniref:large ribosomal RNA subunit accumulation protein YCED homolog 1, chloroplastic n=1 Tax=Solanum dulcamara TaxID=45834 RepID=UPI0024859B23|nr:large ribosomal RNA subunit accumulation protein YCED homolog 1, chloroplastic [Solanum dulcamara]